ncbi:serine/threonine-protein kinase [Nonomuraea sp. NPDC003804]|uniref:WD40 repeat domain-containing serine/threonine protein kinase n=1 Tax=Nonomuraea sp. NPDC003804 TaxID=3154547 RepID=UPI0033B4CD9C
MGVLRRLHPGEPPEVGGYRLVGGIGDGGQGSVFLGEGPDGRRVAVKILHARLLGDQHARRRFLQEGATAARVAAFSTAKVIETGLAQGRPYIVSEYVEGPSLQELVAKEGPRAGGALDRLAVGTAAALAAIHRAGIVHRDFKPSNVIIGLDGPRVIDFGIAKAVDAGTTASSVVGTPGYMSPEQIAGRPAGPASDMFAWATTMAYAATGRALFAGESIPAVMHRILTAQPDLRGVGEPLRSLLAACLAKEPDSRPSADEVLHALLDGTTTRGTAPGNARPSRASSRDSSRASSPRARRAAPVRRRPLAVGAVGAVLMTGLAAGLVWQGGTTAPSAGGGAVAAASPAPAFGRRIGAAFGRGTVNALAVGRLNGAAVVAAAEAGTGELSVWDPVKGGLVARAPRQRARGLGSLTFADVGGRQALVWAADDGAVRWWYPGSSVPVKAISVCEGRPHLAVVQRPEGAAAVAGCAEGRIQAWDLATGGRTGTFLLDGRGTGSLSSAGDGESVFVGGSDGRVKRWRPWAGTPRPETMPWEGAVAVHAAVPAAGRRVLAVQGRGQVEVVDSDGGQETCRVDSAPPFLAASGNLLVGAGDGVRVWDLATCRPYATVIAAGEVGAVATGVVGGEPVVVAGVAGRGVAMWSLDGVPAGRGR